MEILLVLPGTPTAKQSVRVSPVYNKKGEPVTFLDKNSGKKRVLIRHHQPKELTEKEQNYKLMIQTQIGPDFKPLQGGVAVSVDFVFPPLKSFSKKKLAAIEAGAIVYKTTKPDITDNLSKMLFDAMEGLVYLNDSQVCVMYSVRKYYGFKPMIRVLLKSLDD